jgi:hypothetical protein
MNSNNIVVPAKAGTQEGFGDCRPWIPAFAGMMAKDSEAA